MGSAEVKEHDLEKNPANDDDERDEENGCGTIESPIGIRKREKRASNICGRNVVKFLKQTLRCNILLHTDWVRKERQAMHLSAIGHMLDTSWCFSYLER